MTAKLMHITFRHDEPSDATIQAQDKLREHKDRQGCIDILETGKWTAISAENLRRLLEPQDSQCVVLITDNLRHT